MKISSRPNTSVLQVPQPPICKLNAPYSDTLSFSRNILTPRSGFKKCQTMKVSVTALVLQDQLQGYFMSGIQLFPNILLNFLSKQYIPSCWIKLIILPQAAFFKILSPQEKGGDTMNSEQLNAVICLIKTYFRFSQFSFKFYMKICPFPPNNRILSDLLCCHSFLEYELLTILKVLAKCLLEI